jgi:hypothetical protein
MTDLTHLQHLAWAIAEDKGFDKGDEYTVYKEEDI